MRLGKLLQYFSVLNKISAKERLAEGLKFPRIPTESIVHQQPLSNVGVLSPFQQYLLDHHAMERPFTGKLWH